MRRAVLALPVLALVLNADLIFPARARRPSERPAEIENILPLLPAVDAGRFGKDGDPLNLVFVGSEDSVRAALESAGWSQVPTTIPASVRAGLAEILAGRASARFPPLNDYRVDGRSQDMNWAIPVRPILERHHFRIWRTGWTAPDGRQVWWGSGNYDLTVRWRDLSHVPDPDMNRERDFIAETLKGRPGVASLELAALPQIPRAGSNDKGYAFRTDGRALLVRLAAPGGPSGAARP